MEEKELTLANLYLKKENSKDEHWTRILLNEHCHRMLEKSSIEGIIKDEESGENYVIVEVAYENGVAKSPNYLRKFSYEEFLKMGRPMRIKETQKTIYNKVK